MMSNDRTNELINSIKEKKFFFQIITYRLSSTVAPLLALSFAGNSEGLEMKVEKRVSEECRLNLVYGDGTAGATTHWALSLVDQRTVAPFSSVVVDVPIEDRSTSLY